jgi:hypothetical protein
VHHEAVAELAELDGFRYRSVRPSPFRYARKRPTDSTVIRTVSASAFWFACVLVR